MAIAFIADASLFASSPICSWTLLSLCAAALKALHREPRRSAYILLLTGLTRVISFCIRALLASDRSSKPWRN
jgi:hypothetical protein